MNADERVVKLKDLLSDRGAARQRAQRESIPKLENQIKNILMPSLSNMAAQPAAH